MSHKKTKVALVLDRSGSMASVRDDAIKGFNRAIEEIQETSEGGGETTVTLILFNHDVKFKLRDVSVDRLKLLDRSSFKPSGSTALRDAVGAAIRSIRHDSLNPEDAALVIVVTDGYENASKNWSQGDLAEKIQELEDTDQWTFTFMCANVNPKEIEKQFNVPTNNVASFAATKQGLQGMSATMTSSIGGYMSARNLGETQVKNFYEEENKSEHS